MAEEKHGKKDEHKAGEHAPGHDAHADHGGGDDPMHHILDKVLWGVDATTGKVYYKPFGDHGHLTVAGYTPKMVGPFKMEFTKHMAGLTVGALLFFIITMMVAKRVLAAVHDNKAPKGALANAVEALIIFVRDELVEPVGGHHLAHYTPLFLNYFFFILILNFLGMVPEYGGVTGNFSVTLAMGGSIYLLVWVLGMANQGPVNFLVHLVPPGTPLWMWPLMFVLELLGPLIKCFVLCVRLFANMIAGHLIISQLLGLGAISGLLLFLGVPLALGISVLEILVCFLQAYVFTLLAIVFIGAAVHPEH
ncbi:MAG TPA: F0F1 ATP synthase subunit A [Planctomycetota bacterium]|nr:F0F1 ATP synthase subunit A [Planctomycetota bacterium]